MAAMVNEVEEIFSSFPFPPTGPMRVSQRGRDQKESSLGNKETWALGWREGNWIERRAERMSCRRAHVGNQTRGQQSFRKATNSTTCRNLPALRNKPNTTIGLFLIELLSSLELSCFGPPPCSLELRTTNALLAHVLRAAHLTNCLYRILDSKIGLSN